MRACVRVWRGGEEAEGGRGGRGGGAERAREGPGDQATRRKSVNGFFCIEALEQKGMENTYYRLPEQPCVSAKGQGHTRANMPRQGAVCLKALIGFCTVRGDINMITACACLGRAGAAHWQYSWCLPSDSPEFWTEVPFDTMACVTPPGSIRGCMRHPSV